jgi:ferredoxin-NADP reductase
MSRVDRLSLRVREVEALSPYLKRITLVSATGDTLPTSMPGAHIALTVHGPDRIIRNSYSIVSHYNERDAYQIIVRLTDGPRGGSSYIHEHVLPGMTINASVPNSQFPIQATARKHLLIGGGVGITPLLSFLPAIRASGQLFEMHQLGRAGELPVFEKLLEDWMDHNVHLHAGRTNFELDAILLRQPLGTHLYCCGPQPLIDATTDAALRLGWPAGNIHSEEFGVAGGDPFTVRLAKTGIDVRVDEHETMLSALENANVPVSSLCRGGACGECRMAVLEGQPDHRDHFLTEEEKRSNNYVMPCVSRCKGEILLVDM